VKTTISLKADFSSEIVFAQDMIAYSKLTREKIYLSYNQKLNMLRNEVK
jgi:hypothetical protein